MLQLVYCLIGSKVDAISSALTWVHAHAHITLPLVAADALLLSSAQTDDLTSELTNPKSNVSTASLVDKMISSYAKSLEQQRMGFFVCLAIWGIVVLMALVGLFWELEGAEAWAGWRGKPRPSSDGGQYRSAMSEKGDLRPFHLRSESLVKPTKDVLTPTPALRDPPPPSSAASWGSLVEFFRPSTSTEEPPALEMSESNRRPFVLKAPSLPRFKPHFPSWELASSSPVSRPLPRRNSDQVDLRSGVQLDRPFPSHPSKSKMVMLGAASRLAGAVKSRAGARKRRTQRMSSLTSFTWDQQRRECEGTDWARMADDAPSDDEGPHPSALVPPSIFRHPLQQPLSPPPNASLLPHLFPVSSFPPLKPDNISQPRRQISTYRPSSRPRPASAVNPFATPFDGPGE